MHCLLYLHNNLRIWRSLIFQDLPLGCLSPSWRTYLERNFNKPFPIVWYCFPSNRESKQWMLFEEKLHKLSPSSLENPKTEHYLLGVFSISIGFQGRMSHEKIEYAFNPLIFQDDEYDPFSWVEGSSDHPWNYFCNDLLLHIPAGKPASNIMIYGLAGGVSLAISITSLIVLISVL